MTQKMYVPPKVYIVLVNYNNWGDTIECLESIFRNAYPNYRVIVCDNNSSDGSIEHIRAWVAGRLDVAVSSFHPLRRFSFPPVEKNIRWVQYNREEAEQGGDLSTDAQLVLIQSGANLGYAGGNNVAIRYALARNDFEYVWLLNNDTVIEPKSLVELVQTMEKDTMAGMCGSTFLYYDEPGKIQALGGAIYYKFLGGLRFIGNGLDFGTPIQSSSNILSLMDCVFGASLFVRKSLLKEVGLICEDYFLYFEEIDWALRAKGRFSLAYAEGSVVYHKDGGSSCKKAELSLMADYYNCRNRILFTKKFYPNFLPFIYLGLIVAWLNRLRRRQWARSLMVLRLLFGLPKPPLYHEKSEPYYNIKV